MVGSSQAKLSSQGIVFLVALVALLAFSRILVNGGFRIAFLRRLPLHGIASLLWFGLIRVILFCLHIHEDDRSTGRVAPISGELGIGATMVAGG